GDLEETSESRLQSTRGVDLDSDVLKVGHHGSSTSSTDSFLGVVSPQVAIISVGANNSYGYPHEETLNRITAAGTLHVLRTDLNGTISITTSGSSEYTIDTSSKTVTVPEFEIALAIASGAFSAIIVTRVRIWKWQQA
ncbi:MAG: ComEC/Rec2 family competence protein, partial [Nitrososphaera sp.]